MQGRRLSAGALWKELRRLRRAMRRALSQLHRSGTNRAARMILMKGLMGWRERMVKGTGDNRKGRK